MRKGDLRTFAVLVS